jgi:hypothetical protein
MLYFSGDGRTVRLTVRARIEKTAMDHFSTWVMGFCCAAMGVAGLFVAARGGEGVPYYGGLGFFLFSILFVFMLIKISFDEQHKR